MDRPRDARRRSACRPTRSSPATSSWHRPGSPMTLCQPLGEARSFRVAHRFRLVRECPGVLRPSGSTRTSPSRQRRPAVQALDEDELVDARVQRREQRPRNAPQRSLEPVPAAQTADVLQERSTSTGKRTETLGGGGWARQRRWTGGGANLSYRRAERSRFAAARAFAYRCHTHGSVLATKLSRREQLDGCIRWSGLAWLVRQTVARRRVSILMYHDPVPTIRRPPLLPRPAVQLHLARRARRGTRAA